MPAATFSSELYLLSGRVVAGIPFGTGNTDESTGSVVPDTDPEGAIGPMDGGRVRTSVTLCPEAGGAFSSGVTEPDGGGTSGTAGAGGPSTLGGVGASGPSGSKAWPAGAPA